VQTGDINLTLTILHQKFVVLEACLSWGYISLGKIITHTFIRTFCIKTSARQGMFGNVTTRKAILTIQVVCLSVRYAGKKIEINKKSNTYLLIYGAEPFLRSCQLCSPSGNTQHFMEPEGSIPCSQEPSTGPYPEPYQSNPLHSIRSYLSKIH
jgi:hypothetical protein